jgi:SAM-dependent methyltransferase
VVTPHDKTSVRQYWEFEPCGRSLSSSDPGSLSFFDEIERRRYEQEPFIMSFAEFERWGNCRVLEIGVGVGTDFTRFVRAGAEATGIDLTEAAVSLVRRRLELEHLAAEVRVADAESLPFEDGTFDLVYSWGVLHHTPDTVRAIAEAHRVLRPGGQARIMLYSRRSWVALGVWLRYGLIGGRPWRSISSLLADHMESPGTKAFTQSELESLFHRFSRVAFTRFVTPYDRRVGGPLTRIGRRRFGWFVGITAER